MPSYLSTSPTSVASHLEEKLKGSAEELDAQSVGSKHTDSSSSSSLPSPLTLQEFVTLLPETIRETSSSSSSEQKAGQVLDDEFELHEEQGEGNDADRGSADDPISALYRRLVLDKDEWERFALFDASKNYTRNLIATDHETFTLILMCWNPAKESPIHDHPCDGCWMRVCQGSVREVRYVRDEMTDSLKCTSDSVFVESELAYITDSMGYHKVGNQSDNTPAITMHLYSPPFQTCKIWLNPSQASRPSRSCMCFHSEFGCLI